MAPVAKTLLTRVGNASGGYMVYRSHSSKGVHCFPRYQMPYGALFPIVQEEKIFPYNLLVIFVHLLKLEKI